MLTFADKNNIVLLYFQIYFVNCGGEGRMGGIKKLKDEIIVFYLFDILVKKRAIVDFFDIILFLTFIIQFSCSLILLYEVV